MVEYNDEEVFRVFLEQGEQGLEDLIIDKDPDKSDAELDLLIEQLTEKAFSILEKFPESDYKRSLKKLLNYTISRNI